MWKWIKSNKIRSLLGASAATSAIIYTFREPILDFVKPMTEKLLEYAMEQQLAAMKLQSRAEARTNQLKVVGSSTYKSTGDFFPLILKRIKDALSVKKVIEEYKMTKTSDISTPELKRQVAKIKADMFNEIITSRLAEYAACIYTTGLLLSTFRLYLIVLARHTLDRQPPLPKGTDSSISGGSSQSVDTNGETKGTDPLDLIEAAKRFGLNDLRSDATREAIHLRAWNVIVKSLGSITKACKQAAEDCLSDTGWTISKCVNSSDVSNLMDKILGHTHELLFNPTLEHVGCSLNIQSHLTALEHPEEACASVIIEANCMLSSPVFLDVVASTTSSVAIQYAKILTENLEASIPRDGPCKVDQEKLAAFLNQISGVDELVPTFVDVTENPNKGETKNNAQKENGENEENRENEENESGDVPKCDRKQLCELLLKDNGAMIYKLAGFGPKMSATKQCKQFIDQCIRVIREGPDDIPVDSEEVTEVLNAVIEDVSSRVKLYPTAVGKTVLGKTQSTMMKVSSSTTKSPLDDVLNDENLGHFLGGVFEDVVDVVVDRQKNGVNDDDGNNEEEMMMKQLQGIMKDSFGDLGGNDSAGLNLEAMMKAVGDGNSGGTGGSDGTAPSMGAPDMNELNNLFAQMGESPPTADELTEMFQQMMSGGMPNGMPPGGMPNPNELQDFMKQLQQDPGPMKQIMEMANQMAASVGNNQSNVGDVD
jgi:hypothetical protein